MCVQGGSDPREIRIKEDGKKRTTKTQSNKQTKNPESKQTNKQQQQKKTPSTKPPKNHKIPTDQQTLQHNAKRRP